MTQPPPPSLALSRTQTAPQLTADALLCVLAHVDFRTLVRAMRVSKRWHAVASSNVVWAAVLQRHFGSVALASATSAALDFRASFGALYMSWKQSLPAWSGKKSKRLTNAIDWGYVLFFLMMVMMHLDCSEQNESGCRGRTSGENNEEKSVGVFSRCSRAKKFCSRALFSFWATLSQIDLARLAAT